MTKDYINRTFGETLNPANVRNSYFVIEPRKGKRANFLDEDEQVYMEQHNTKASHKKQGISAKQ